MRKYLLLIALLAAPVIGLSACGGNDDEPQTGKDHGNVTITVSPTSIEAEAEGAEVTLTVDCKDEWTVFADDEWVKVAKQRDNKTVKVTISKNNSFNARNGKITVKSGSNYGYVTVSQKAEVADESIKAPEGYTLVWHDEFDEGTRPNTAEWWYETGAGGWGNNEIQNYVNNVTPKDVSLASIDKGILTITCLKEGNSVYSIRMNTKRNWKYGWFEARLKLPVGKGTWPAFWMMPANFTSWPEDGEIDIMEEVGYHPNYVSSSVHCGAYNHPSGTQKTREILCSTAQTEFHTYALEWTEDVIRTYVDGKKLFEFENDHSGKKSTWPFNAPFYLKLNLAWGGNWGGAMGVDESALPAHYQVDYVRVFQKK